MKLACTLPYPPTVNHYWVMGQGRIYISAKGRAYARQVAGLLKGAPTFEGLLHVTIIASPPDDRRRDLDNVLKCLLDAITKAGVWKDDSQIDYLAICRGEPKAPGNVELVVEQIET